MSSGSLLSQFEVDDVYDYERGHGTYVENEEVVASLAGVVSRVNKLVTVKALKSRQGPSCNTFLGLTYPQVYSRSR